MKKHPGHKNIKHLVIAAFAASVMTASPVWAENEGGGDSAGKQVAGSGGGSASGSGGGATTASAPASGGPGVY